MLRRSTMGRISADSAALAAKAANELRIHQNEGERTKSIGLQTLASPPIKLKTILEERHEFLDAVIAYLKDRTLENRNMLYKASKKLMLKTVATDKKAMEIVARFGKDHELLANLLDRLEASGLNISPENWRKIRAAILAHPPNSPHNSKLSTGSTASNKSTSERASDPSRIRDSNNTTKNNTYDDPIRPVGDANEANNNIADTNDAQGKRSSADVSNGEGGTQHSPATEAHQSHRKSILMRSSYEAQQLKNRESKDKSQTRGVLNRNSIRDSAEISTTIWGLLRKQPPRRESDVESGPDFCAIFDEERDGEDEEKTFGQIAKDLKQAIYSNSDITLISEDSSTAESSDEGSGVIAMPEPKFEYRDKNEVASTEIVRDAEGSEKGSVFYDRSSRVVTELVVDGKDKFSCLEYDKSGEVLLIVQFDAEGNELSRFDFMKARGNTPEHQPDRPRFKTQFKKQVKQMMRDKRIVSEVVQKRKDVPLLEVEEGTSCTTLPCRHGISKTQTTAVAAAKKSTKGGHYGVLGKGTKSISGAISSTADRPKTPTQSKEGEYQLPSRSHTNFESLISDDTDREEIMNRHDTGTRKSHRYSQDRGSIKSHRYSEDRANVDGQDTYLSTESVTNDDTDRQEVTNSNDTSTEKSRRYSEHRASIKSLGYSKDRLSVEGQSTHMITQSVISNDTDGLEVTSSHDIGTGKSRRHKSDSASIKSHRYNKDRANVEGKRIHRSSHSVTSDDTVKQEVTTTYDTGTEKSYRYDEDRAGAEGQDTYMSTQSLTEDDTDSQEVTNSYDTSTEKSRHYSERRASKKSLGYSKDRLGVEGQSTGTHLSTLSVPNVDTDRHEVTDSHSSATTVNEGLVSKTRLSSKHSRVNKKSQRGSKGIEKKESTKIPDSELETKVKKNKRSLRMRKKSTKPDIDMSSISPEQKIRRSSEQSGSISLQALNEALETQSSSSEIEKERSTKSTETRSRSTRKESTKERVSDPTPTWKGTEKADVTKYLASHEIYELFQFMMTNLIHVKPEKPIDYLISMTRTMNKNIQNHGTFNDLGGEEVSVP